MTELEAKIRDAAGFTLPPRTMAELLDCVRSDAELTPTKRREAVAHIRRLERALGMRLSQVPASARYIRQRLDRARARQIARAGGLGTISDKSFRNMVSGLKWVLRRYGSAPSHKPSWLSLAPEWQALREAIAKPGMRYALSRFMRYCSSAGIAPGQVDDEILSDFHAWLGESEIGKSPDGIHHRTIEQWNRAVDQVGGWPPRRLARPVAREAYTFAWSELPEPLRRDAEAWLAHLGGSDLFGAGPPRPVRPATIESRRFQIRQIVSALHHRGYDVAAFTGLADLVSLERAREVLRFFHDRHVARGGDPGEGSSMMAGIAGSLAAIAEHWIEIDTATLKEFKRFKARVTPRHTGLRPKNRSRLEPFLDERNQGLLLHLPQRLARRVVSKRRPSRDDALTMQMAVAIELLLMTAMRLGNLTALEMERHLRRYDGADGRRWLIAVPETEVKNARPLDFELPRPSAALLERYLRDFHPMLAEAGDNRLFPGARPGRHKAPAHLSRQITARIRKETGLVVNAHLFRHIDAMLYLLDHPGGYEVVRRLLAHSSAETTIANYAGLETHAAVRHFAQSILERRDRLPAEWM